VGTLNFAVARQCTTDQVLSRAGMRQVPWSRRLALGFETEFAPKSRLASDGREMAADIVDVRWARASPQRPNHVSGRLRSRRTLSVATLDRDEELHDGLVESGWLIQVGGMFGAGCRQGLEP